MMRELGFMFGQCSSFHSSTSSLNRLSVARGRSSPVSLRQHLAQSRLRVALLFEPLLTALALEIVVVDDVAGLPGVDGSLADLSHELPPLARRRRPGR